MRRILTGLTTLPRLTWSARSTSRSTSRSTPRPSPSATRVLRKRAPVTYASAADPDNDSPEPSWDAQFDDRPGKKGKKPKWKPKDTGIRAVSGIRARDHGFFWEGTGAHHGSPLPVGQRIIAVHLSTGRLGWPRVTKSWTVRHLGPLFESKTHAYDLVSTGDCVVHGRHTHATRGVHTRSSETVAELQQFSRGFETPGRRSRGRLQARQVSTIWTNPLSDFDWLTPFVNAGALQARWLNDPAYATQALPKMRLFLDWIGYLFADGGWTWSVRGDGRHDPTYLVISQWTAKTSSYLHELTLRVYRAVGALPNSHWFRLTPGFDGYVEGQKDFTVRVLCAPLLDLLRNLLDGPLTYEPHTPAHQAAYDPHDATLVNQRNPPPPDVCPRDGNKQYVKRYFGWLAHRLSKAMARCLILGWSSGDGEWKFFEWWFKTPLDSFGSGLDSVNSWVTDGSHEMVTLMSSMPCVWDFLVLGMLAEYRVSIDVRAKAGYRPGGTEYSPTTVPAFGIRYTNNKGVGWSGMAYPWEIEPVAGGEDVMGVQCEEGWIPEAVRWPEWDWTPVASGAMNVAEDADGHALVHMRPSLMEFPNSA